MKSYQVLKETVNTIGTKAVATEMSLSSSLIYKWCECSEGADATGTGNPLDRVLRIVELTDNTAPLEWLCERLDGYFVKNPEVGNHHKDPMLHVTRRILQEFTELLDAVSESMESDGQVDTIEAERIRHEWEDLKRVCEHFVVSCEAGAYGA